MIMIWVESEADKLALIQDPDSPFFTTDRFDGHLSVLVRAKDLREIGRVEVTRLESKGKANRRVYVALAEEGGR